MTTHVVTDDALGKVARRWWEVERRLMEGTLSPDKVARGLQQIVEDNDQLPTTMTVGGRTYEILSFLRGDEKSVVGQTMVERANEMQAHLGQDDGQYLLDHQEEIPEVLRGKVVFVFTDWRDPGDPERVAFVLWCAYRWVRYWYWLGRGWAGGVRVLRRK